MSELSKSDQRPLFDTDRAARLMREAGIELLLASRRHNVAYLTGIFSHLYWEYPEVAHCLEREDDGCESPYYFAALPQEMSQGDKGAFVVAHENRAGIWKNKGWIADVKPCCDQPGKQKAIAQLLEGIRERGLESATIGVERNHLPINIFEELRVKLPKAKFVDATPTLWQMRMVKTEEERSRQRQAYRIAEDIYRQLFQTMARQPLTVAQARGLQMQLATESGCPPLHFGYIFPQDGKGKRGWAADASQFTIEPGNVILLDLGLIWKGYTTDFGRVAVMGKVSAKLKDAFALIQKTREVIAAAIKLGVRACEVYRAGAAFQEKQGLRGGSWLGHGLGIECHEPPVLSPDDETMLEAGMVIVIELGGGVDGISFLLEDGGVITAEGWQSLTTMPTDLIEIELTQLF